ncbi:MAG: AMP-binding protein [Nocardioidaceae bacterium]
MTSASLRPVAGTAGRSCALLRDWLTVGAAVDPLVVRTSGSSGLPKDVVLSREALLASARATHHRLGGPGRWMLDLPVHHVAGLQVLIRSVIAGSVPVVAAEHGGLPAALAAVSTERTYVSLVPTQLHRLAESGLLGTLARCEAVLVGGAFLSPRLAVAAGEAGVRVVRTYGMSETGGGASTTVSRWTVSVSRSTAEVRCTWPGRCSSSGTTTIPKRRRRCFGTAGSPPPTSASSTPTAGCASWVAATTS